MDPSEYLAVLRKNWLVIALIGVLGAGAGFAYSATVSPSYKATSSVYVSLKQGSSVGELVQGAAYAQDLVQSYAQLATMPIVLEPVIERLDLTTTPRVLARSITATSPLQTVILEISAASASAQGAADLSNAVSKQLAVAVTGLGTPDGPTVYLTTVAEATPPAAAFSPNTRLNVATGLAVGIMLCMAFVLARSVLDTRIRSAKEVARVTSTAVLSTVRYERKAGRHTLAMRDDPYGDRAEAYRRLRTNLRFLNLTGSSRSIVITSALAAEGKSTTAINLAIAMSEGSARILLIDADLRWPSIAHYMGIDGSVGLTTVLIGEADLDDVIQPWGEGNLHVLPAGQIPPNPSELLDSPTMASLLARLAERYDVILLDSAPLLPVTDAAILSRLTDGALVVVGCREARRPQLADGLSTLAAVDARVLGLVLNQVSGAQSGGYYVPGTTPRTTAVRRPWSRQGKDAGAKTVKTPRASRRSRRSGATTPAPTPRGGAGHVNGVAPVETTGALIGSAHRRPQPGTAQDPTVTRL